MMGNFRSILLAGLLLAFAGGLSYGTTYYVATNGNDNNPGTQALPWATLQKAVDTIANGDTALVQPGTYVGCRIRYGAAAGSPKTIRANGAVLINAPGPLCRRPSDIEIISDDFGATPTPYWVIDGFEVTNSPKWGIDGIGGTYITIQNNRTHNNGTSSACTGIHQAFGDGGLIQNNTSYSNAEHGLYTCNSADNGTVRGNVFYSNVSLGHHMNGDSKQGGDGIMSGWLVEKNISYLNGSNGFDGDGVITTTWKNNLAYNNVSKGIHLCQVNGSQQPTSDRVLNNTLVVQVGGYYCLTFYKGKGKVGGTNNAAINNICYNYDITNSMRGSIMYVSSWMSTFTSDYNVVVDRFAVDDNRNKYTLAQWRSTYGKDMNSTLCLDANAIFVNPVGNDWHLKAGSPAINAGTTLTDVTDDLEGYARTAPYDCGCYEYH